MSGRRRVGTRQRSPGQALVEFALIAPIFFVMMFGLVEFGRAVYYVQVANNAAREGARYAIVHGSQSMRPSGPMLNGNFWDPTGRDVVDAVQGFAVGMDPAYLDVMVCWNGKPPSPAAASCDNASGDYGPGNNDPGSTIYVRVTYQFRPALSDVLPLPSFTLMGESILVINH